MEKKKTTKKTVKKSTKKEEVLHLDVKTKEKKTKKKEKAENINDVVSMRNLIAEMSKYVNKFSEDLSAKTGVENITEKSSPFFNPVSQIVVKESSIKNIDKVSLLNRRTLYLSDDIIDESSSEVIKELLALDAKSNEPIKLIITSYGGSVLHGLAIIDIIKSITSPVDVVITGAAFSMAAVIAASVKGKGKRYMTRNSMYMLHKLSTMTFGNLDDIIISTNFLKDLQNKLNKVILDNTDISKSELDQKLRDGDWFLTAEECLKYGIIDEII